MKKIFKICLCILPIMFMTVIYAGEATLDTIDIKAEILDNGDMQVTESLDFKISGSLNGLYRDILLSSEDKYGASSMDVIEVLVNGESALYAPLELSLGEDGKYNINSITDGKQVKIFTPSSNETKNVKITYVLHDVVLKYSDIAELHWNFIGSGWESSINEVNITITAPGKSEALRAWGHGPLNGVIELKDNDTVILKATNVDANAEVTARMAMDKNLFTTVKKEYEVAALDNILTEEEKYAAEANARREASKYGVYILITDVIFMIICPIIWYNKKKKEFEVSDFDGKYYRELPEDYGPAVMTEVLGTKAISSVMPATMMNLARKKHIKITEIKNKKGKADDYEIELVDKEKLEQDETVAENEKYFALNMLFDNETKFTLKEFEKRFKKQSEQSAAVAKHNTWFKKITEDAKLYGEFKGKDRFSCFKNCWLCILLPITVSVISMLFGLGFEFDDITGISMLLFVVNLTAESLTMASIFQRLKYTKKGITHKKMWEAFSKFLEDFSKMEDYPVQSLVVWEHYLVYAVALGKARKVIKQLEVMYPTELNSANDTLYTNYAIMNLCRDSSAYSSFDKTFSSAMTTAFTPQSSGSGSGGGFSGGGGSGGGGGGGGGF